MKLAAAIALAVACGGAAEQSPRRYDAWFALQPHGPALTGKCELTLPGKLCQLPISGTVAGGLSFWWNGEEWKTEPGLDFPDSFTVHLEGTPFWLVAQRHGARAGKPSTDVGR